MNRIMSGHPDDWLDWRPGSGGTIEVFDIVVNSSRRSGRGRRMMYKLLDSLPAGTLVWAITRIENAIAQQFYESLRFRIVGVLRNFYADGDGGQRVDAIMYGFTVGGVA